MAITENHWVVLDSSVGFSLPRILMALLRMGTILDAVSFSQRKARVLLIARNGGAARTIDLDRPLLSVHHANAWEENGAVVLITCGLDDFAFGKEFGWNGPHSPLDSTPPGNGQKVFRIEVGPGGGSRVRVISDCPLDFPRVRPERDGLPTRHVWGMVTRNPSASAMFWGVGHVDLETGTSTVWTPGPGQMVGEPLVVPFGEAEDAVWIVVMLYDGQNKQSRLAVLDGRAVDRGPVAQVHLPLLLPYGFHGCWEGASN